MSARNESQHVASERREHSPVDALLTDYYAVAASYARVKVPFPLQAGHTISSCICLRTSGAIRSFNCRMALPFRLNWNRHTALQNRCVKSHLLVGLIGRGPRADHSGPTGQANCELGEPQAEPRGRIVARKSFHDQAIVT